MSSVGSRGGPYKPEEGELNELCRDPGVGTRGGPYKPEGGELDELCTGAAVSVGGSELRTVLWSF